MILLPSSLGGRNRPRPVSALRPVTEYEAATLAIRTAGLWAAYGQIAATPIVGVLHAALIFAGLRAMRRASDRRDRALDVQERAADQRHTESMRALDQQASALRELGTALRQQGAALRQQGAALAAILDRTGAGQ